MAMVGRHRSFGQRLLGHAQTAVKWGGAAHTAYQVGRGLYQAAQYAAPIAAALL